MAVMFCQGSAPNKSQGVRVAAPEQKNRQGQLHVLPNHLGMLRDSETPAAQTMHALHFFWYKAADLKIWVNPWTIVL